MPKDLTGDSAGLREDILSSFNLQHRGFADDGARYLVADANIA
jgi:hypothetical protein